MAFRAFDREEATLESTGDSDGQRTRAFLDLCNWKNNGVDAQKHALNGCQGQTWPAPVSTSAHCEGG